MEDLFKFFMFPMALEGAARWGIGDSNVARRECDSSIFIGKAR